MAFLYSDSGFNSVYAALVRRNKAPASRVPPGASESRRCGRLTTDFNALGFVNACHGGDAKKETA
jgi:hypothetical protein